MTEPAYDLLIRGGRVATASDVFEADVAISGETIAAVGRGLPGACRAASTATPISNSCQP